MWEAIGDERRLSHGLVILSRQQRADRASCRRAGRPPDGRSHSLESDGDTAGHALARMNVGALD